jgi:hypothetical protein
VKPSEKIKARDAAVAARKSARLRRIGVLFFQVTALIGVIAGVIAAVQPLSDLAAKAPTAQIIAPRSAAAAIEPKKMILLDSHFDQRFFYFVDKRKVSAGQPFLIGFPFSIRNSGEKRLEHVTITFSFEHTSEGLRGKRPSLSDEEWPLFADIPWQAIDVSGRNELQRKLALSPKVASVTFSGMEVLPNNEHFFEFHFAPRLYPVSIIENGEEVPVAVYDVKATVVADGFNQSQRFRILVLPGDDEADFSVGVNLFSRFLACKHLCNAPWLRQQIHKVPWLATRLTQEYENVIVRPSPLYAQAPNGVFRVLKPDSEIEVNRFVQVLGTARAR